VDFRTVIGDIPRIHSQRAPDDLAFVDGPVRLSWGAFDDRVNRLGNALRDEFGTGVQDRLAVLAGNCHEYLDVVFAASRLKAVYTGLNTRHHPSEMIGQVRDCAARLLFVGPGFEEAGGVVARETGALPIHFRTPGPGRSYTELLAAGSPEVIDSHQDPEATYALTYTSGTTGRPKGAMISSRNEAAFVHSLIIGSETRVDDRFMLVTPLFHKGGQFAVMHAAYLGLPTVILPRPDPGQMCLTIERERISVFLAVPTIMKMLVEHVEMAGAGRYDLSSLRHVLYGSNPIQVAQIRRFVELFSVAMCQIGGIGTEGGAGLILDRVDHERALADPALTHRLESCGRVQPGFQMKVVDDDGREVQPGDLGELVFRGDAYIAGYWNKPAASQRAWRDGWLHSGDIGRRDRDGYVYYVDRMGGRIKTGGETVYPREVEDAVRGHAAVRDVAVVGVPDERWGEQIWAVVEHEPLTALAGSALEQELRERVRERIASYKVPKHVLFVDALPRTALGKIAIADVRALAVAAATAVPTGGR
jgi:acyl-CoA synthetase (AMP-forming)/AMP-acid ligase II